MPITRRTARAVSQPDSPPASFPTQPSRKRKRLSPATISPTVPPSDIEDLPKPCALPTPEEAYAVLNALQTYFNSRPHTSGGPDTNILDSLVRTMLSQATTNTNSSRAFASLKSAYPTWAAAHKAGVEAIASKIRIGGLADPKAKAIHTVLSTVPRVNDEPSLDYLHDKDEREVRDILCSFKGVGPKTAACVLMFAMARSEFPVDTHVARISRRLGWVQTNDSPESIYQSLNDCLPQDTKYGLHVLLIRLGRQACRARAPNCEGCPLVDKCVTGRRTLDVNLGEEFLNGKNEQCIVDEKVKKLECETIVKTENTCIKKENGVVKEENAIVECDVPSSRRT